MEKLKNYTFREATKKEFEKIVKEEEEKNIIKEKEIEREELRKTCNNQMENDIERLTKRIDNINKCLKNIELKLDVKNKKEVLQYTIRFYNNNICNAIHGFYDESSMLDYLLGFEECLQLYGLDKLKK